MEDLKSSFKTINEDGTWEVEKYLDEDSECLIINIYFKPIVPVKYITLEHIVNTFPVKYISFFERE